jgi:hypothetical protein
MKSFTRRTVIIVLLLATQTKAHSCSCQHFCSILEQVRVLFTTNLPPNYNWIDQIVIVKAAYIDSIPNSYDGSKLKLLAQYYGRPVKDTFNLVPVGTDCDLDLRQFHKYNTDTLFLILHHRYFNRYGDTTGYSLTMCGKEYAVVRNDSVIEYCGAKNITASDIADSLRQTIHTLGIEPTNVADALKAYPNPARGYLTLDGAKGRTGVLINYLGQQAMLFNINTDRQSIDISSLPAGVYSLQVNDNAGGKRVLRVVKE